MGKRLVVTQSIIDRVRKMASKGMLKSEIIAFSNISKEAYYDYQRIAESYVDKDLTPAEIKELPEKHQRAIKLFNAFNEGRAQFGREALDYFSNIDDWKLKMELFKRVFHRFEFDLETLDAELARQFGRAKARAVIDILLDEDFGEDGDER